ncbi:MAG: pilin [Patescibacteria group bacterium]|nr:pilin [Patescibacteria group bacterium]
MKKIFLSLIMVGLSAFVAAAFLSPPALAVNTAKTCAEAGGACKYDCDANTDSYANSKLGCTDSCCIPKGNACKDHGGTCSSGCGTGMEVAPNPFDCLESCCVPAGTASGIQPKQGGADAKTTAKAYDKSLCNVPGTSFQFPCPLGGGAEKLPQVFGRVIKWILGLVGALFFAMFVYGGFLYIIAGDSAKNAETGKKTLINAVMGLVIVIGSYMFVTWIIETFSAGF